MKTHFSMMAAACGLLLIPTGAWGQEVYSQSDIARSRGIQPSQQNCTNAKYPPKLSKAGIGGRVRIEFVVGSDGFVDPVSLKTIESPDPALERATQVMVLNCRFNPGRLAADGDPVPVRMRMAMNFGTRSEPAVATPPPDLATRDLGRIYSLSDTENGRRLVTERPKKIGCPRYDPKRRTARARAKDRYQRDREGEYLPVRVEAVLEVVVGVEGIPEQKLLKIIRSSDKAADDQILQWVQSCRFTPGKIGDRSVRVRIEFPVTFTYVR